MLRGCLPTLLLRIFFCILLGKPAQQETRLLFIAQHKETPWHIVHKLLCILVAELLVSTVFLEVHSNRMKANR